MVEPIAARYALSPRQIWETLSFRQIVIISNYIAREKYREQAFAAALHGCSQEKKDEPVWWLGGDEAPSDIKARCLAEIEEYKRRKALRNHGKQ
ncbi:hypothetical protein IJT93_04765 [bacterium]|nr:hypothetical protein [bacterium]